MSTFTDEEIDKLQEIMNSIPDYFDDVDEIQCPHCGDSLGLEAAEPAFYTEETLDMECDNCNKKFTINGSMSWSWSTEIV